MSRAETDTEAMESTEGVDHPFPAGLVKDEYAGEWFKRYEERSGTGYHILRGTCDATIHTAEGDAICGDTASYRHRQGARVTEWCKRHVPDRARDALGTHKCMNDEWVFLAATCDKMVSAAGRSEFVSADQLYDERALDADQPRARRCGDRALVMVTDTEQFNRSYCRTHTREPWTTGMGIETVGDREFLNPDDPVLLDVETNRMFDSYGAWEDFAQRHYADMSTAHEHTYVHDSA